MHPAGPDTFFALIIAGLLSWLTVTLRYKFRKFFGRYKESESVSNISTEDEATDAIDSEVTLLNQNDVRSVQRGDGMTSKTRKVQDFVSGFILWTVISNVLVIPIGTIIDSILKSRDYETVAKLMAAIILALELVVIAIAFIRKKSLRFGILSSIVAQAIAWFVIINVLLVADGQSLSTAMAADPSMWSLLALPFPMSFLIFMCC